MIISNSAKLLSFFNVMKFICIIVFKVCNVVSFLLLFCVEMCYKASKSATILSFCMIISNSFYSLLLFLYFVKCIWVLSDNFKVCKVVFSPFIWYSIFYSMHNVMVETNISLHAHFQRYLLTAANKEIKHKK